jgi:DNA-binding response OmpR family regulator
MNAAILLVEDDPAARLALSKTLESAGYDVTAAADGTTALTMIQQNEYDVVISDMRLPDIDGIEVLQSAASRPYPPSVILLTGYGTLDTAIAALRAGATDYLLKPCAPQTLIAGVANALRKRAAALRQADTLRNLAEGVAQLQRQLLTIGAGEISGLPPLPSSPTASDGELIVFGQLQIGRFPHDVRYRREPLRLTPIEHALLRCLAEAGGEVVHYHDIVRRTHGYETADSEAQALLKSHVRNLRSKIGADIISSVRNTGYRLVEPGDRLE